MASEITNKVRFVSPPPAPVKSQRKEGDIQAVLPSQKAGERQEVTVTGQMEASQQKDVPAKAENQQGLQQAVSFLNEQVQTVKRSLEFAVEDDTGMVVVSVRDSDTNELIRQIPAEYVVEMARKMQELQEEQTQQNADGLLFRSEA